ncbi:hypothetical protein RclHR1_06730003 [Rhizophagus clarus]|uniref:F-box domain-containing protein n=1 Tax=Rhizophagus clarus TaxID=94130 RepID=A0A2Z6SJD8_9GLOM|nr:hypothetical protein RclHR1_06730003 [Rhizophagus clarus]
MSCSKIFSGDLSELTYDIIKYFQDDFSTLHSCILVNRLWCRLAIPLLWENPFSISTKSSKNYNFIEVYLHNLNDDVMTIFKNEYKINGDLFSSNTLFNYPNFIKYLNTQLIYYSVMEWSKIFRSDNGFFIKDFASVLNFNRLVHMSLFKIFIENEVNLHTLDIELFSHGDFYYDNFELILQNPNFIHNVKNLNLYIGYININSSEYMIVKNRTLQIINLHQNLKKIFISFDSFPLYQSLLLSKHYNCSNTLNIIIFYLIDFKGITNLDKVFEQLNVLESVHLVYCSSLNAGFTQQINNLTKPFKLKSLFIFNGSDIDESLILLLQKSGDYLENFGYEFDFDNNLTGQELFEIIIRYCKNIKLFNLYEIKDQIIVDPALNFIESLKQNLNYLSIDVYETGDAIERSSIILQNLGQILPPILEYLNLVLSIDSDYFEIFLKNSQNNFIKKLLINNRGNFYDILSHIKEYIMKKERIKYLAIINSSKNKKVLGDDELFLLKDEVKEFESYNIKIQKYYDLHISDVLNIRTLLKLSW